MFSCFHIHLIFLSFCATKSNTRNHHDQLHFHYACFYFYFYLFTFFAVLIGKSVVSDFVPEFALNPLINLKDKMIAKALLSSKCSFKLL